MPELLVLLIIPLSRFLININNWNYIRRVINRHDQWLDGVGDNASEEKKLHSKKAAIWLQQQTSEINRVYKLTGRSLPVERYMEPAGYNHVQEKRLNVLDNLLFQNEEILGKARDLLNIAKGHFFNNAKLSLNPIFWLEVLFFLPRTLVSASGVEVTSKVADIGLKITQMLYWLAIVFAFLYKPEFFSFLYDHAKT